MLDPNILRGDFPILGRTINGKPLIYLDNAATTQKPTMVLDALTDFYTRINANVHRGGYTLSHEASEVFEEARSSIAAFIGATSDEVIFTKNARPESRQFAGQRPRAGHLPGDRPGP